MAIKWCLPIRVRKKRIDAHVWIPGVRGLTGLVPPAAPSSAARDWAWKNLTAKCILTKIGIAKKPAKIFCRERGTS